MFGLGNKGAAGAGERLVSGPALVYFKGLMKKTGARRFFLSALLLFPFLWAAAPSLAARGLKVTVLEKNIRDLHSDGLKLVFTLGVTNQEPAERLLVRYEYKVEINQKEFFSNSVSLDEPIRIPSGGDSYIGLPVKITYSYLSATIGELGTGGVCEVRGHLYFQDEKNRESKVSFSASGDFPIFKEPVVSIKPLKLVDLTVGGADLVFSVSIENPNPYALLVDKLGYTLKFADVKVSEGAFEGDKSLPEKGQKTFSLPMLLDFFEIGEGLRTAFGGKEIACDFTGVIEVQSVWGRLVLPFEAKAVLPLEKASRQ